MYWGLSHYIEVLLHMLRGRVDIILHSKYDYVFKYNITHLAGFVHPLTCILVTSQKGRLPTFDHNHMNELQNKVHEL